MGTAGCKTCNPCDGRKSADIVKNDILHGGPASDGLTGTSGAWADANQVQPGLLTRLDNMRQIDAGTMTPDPNSRLGAYAATSGYPAGTVGNSVHNAIGTIYGGMANYGEENIGKVFNSPEAKSMYNDPVDSQSSKCMASVEHAYWEQVKAEDPWSAGGQLGSAFGPTSRDWLQRNVFSSSTTPPLEFDPRFLGP